MERKAVLRALITLACMAASIDAQTVQKVGAIDYRPPKHVGADADQLPLSFAFSPTVIAPKELGSIRAEDVAASHHSMAQRRVVGMQRHVGREIAHGGAWVQHDTVRSFYQVAIRSNGASAMRIHFVNFAAGKGRVWIYSPGRAEVRGPYTGAGVNATGDFWSHTIHGDTAVIEYEPSEPNQSVPFDIPAVGHATDAVDQGVTNVVSPCELDVSCYSDWSPVASGVGMINFVSGGEMNQCTGALINNANSDFTPYFLTAGHCIQDAATAQTVEIVWQYQTGSCNGAQPDPATLPSTLGATYLVGANPFSNASSVGSDFSLLRLSSLPNMNLVFYGWDPDPSAVQVGASLITIHHPEGEVKRVAFANRMPDAFDATWNPIVASLPVGQFYEVSFAGNASGRVEPGSSGAPLLTADRSVVGTFSAIPYPVDLAGQACNYDPFVVQYSRFSNAYSALQPYLGTRGQQVTSTPSDGSGTSSLPSGITVTSAPSLLSWYWTVANPSQSAPSSVQISTSSATPVTIHIGSSQPWISLSEQTLTVSQAAPGILGVALNPAGITNGGMLDGAITLTVGALQTSIAVSLNAVSSGLQPPLNAQVTVFPLVEAGPGFTSSFTLTNPSNSETTAFLSFNNLDGSALIVEPAQFYPVNPAGQTSAATATTVISPAPAEGYPVSFLESMIPAGSTASFATAPVAPLRAGMALSWTPDTQKQLQSALLINGTPEPPATPVALPFAIPFDASSSGSTQVFAYNNAWWGTANLTVTGYDQAGTIIGSAPLTIPTQQAASFVVTNATSQFGGKKGTLVVTGSGSLLAMGLQIDTTGKISPVMPTQAK
jgi:Trypsin-like peptidase domain